MQRFYFAAVVFCCAGGKAGDKEAAAQGKLKRLTKKERAKLRKLQKRQERAAGSDDEDLGTGGLNVKVTHSILSILLSIPLRQIKCTCTSTRQVLY